MATYADLFAIANDDTFIKRVAVAAAIKAESIRTEADPTPQRFGWAIRALSHPEGEARKILYPLLAANSTMTLAQLNGLTDAQMQTAVNNFVEQAIGSYLL